MNIAELLELDRVETREAGWNGVAFNISFYPARLTSPVFVQGMTEGLNLHPLRLADAFEAVLDGWDIEWNGRPFPPTKENLAMLPFGFLVYLSELIFPDDAQPSAS